MNIFSHTTEAAQDKATIVFAQGIRANSIQEATPAGVLSKAFKFPLILERSDIDLSTICVSPTINPALENTQVPWLLSLFEKGCVFCAV